MIFIAGGAGYIGSHVNKMLHEKGYETLVYDNLIHGHREFVKWGEFVLGDLSNKDQIRLCFAKYPISAVMHFGGYTYVGESVIEPGKYYNNNLVNTINLLDVMREFEVKYFIFSSSAAVYGIPNQTLITENHHCVPINPYGRTKLMCEEILKDYERAHNIKHINLRYFNAAGADPKGEIGESHEPETHLIPLVIFTALQLRNKIQIFGKDYPTKDGTCIRDYIHVNDIADAHIKALENLKMTDKSDTFNLGNGNGYSVLEIIDAVRKITGNDFDVAEASRRDGDPPILVSSSKKAFKILGWTPQHENIEGIIETAWNWHRAHQANE